MKQRRSCRPAFGVVQKIDVLPDELPAIVPASLLIEGGDNLFPNAWPLRKRNETLFGSRAVRGVFIIRVVGGDRFYVLRQRLAELVFAFQDYAGLKGVAGFVVGLATQRLDSAQGIVILKIV